MQSLLNKNPILTFVFFLASLQLGLLALYLFNLDSGVDFTGHIVGRDFANMYLGGGLIAQDQIDILFAPQQYWDAMRDWLGPQYPIHNWSYPPIMFWPAELLANLPYFVAYLVWTLSGIGFMALALRTLGISWLWSLLVVFSPAGMWNILAGQNAFFISGLLALSVGYTWENKRFSAGLFWALATVKPHLGLLAVPLLLGKKRFGVILYGGAVLAVMLALVMFRYGVNPWIDFFTITLAQQRLVLENWSGPVEVMVATAFMQGRLLGLPLAFSYGLHAIVAAVGVLLLIRAWPGAKSDKRYWLSWFALGSYLLLPYSFVYDIMLFQVVLVMWRQDLGGLLGVKNREAALGIWFFLWMLPLIVVLIAMLIKVQIMPLALLWLLWRLGSIADENAKADKI